MLTLWLHFDPSHGWIHYVLWEWPWTPWGGGGGGGGWLWWGLGSDGGSTGSGAPPPPPLPPILRLHIAIIVVKNPLLLAFTGAPPPPPPPHFETAYSYNYCQKHGFYWCPPHNETSSYTPACACMSCPCPACVDRKLHPCTIRWMWPQPYEIQSAVYRVSEATALIVRRCSHLRRYAPRTYVNGLRYCT